MSIALNQIIHIKDCKNICYEIGLNYFKIRKAFINDIESFHTLYSNISYNYNEEYYFDKLEKIKTYTYIPNTNDELTLKNNLSYIWRGSFSIVDCSRGSFIIIAYSWNYYLVIEPMFAKATEFMNDELYNYLIIHYKDITLNISQYHRL